MMTSAAPVRVRSPIASDVATTFENVTWSVPSTSIGAATVAVDARQQVDLHAAGRGDEDLGALVAVQLSGEQLAPKLPPAALTQVTSGLVGAGRSRGPA